MDIKQAWNVPLVVFMCLIFTRMPGESYRRVYLCGVYVPCIYVHAWWELPQATQVFVVFVLGILNAN